MSDQPHPIADAAGARASDPPSPIPDPRSPAPVLRVSDLVVEFPIPHAGTTRIARAADGVSLELGKGETLGVVGESGCGKSVTALSVIGLVPAPGRVTSGAVEFEGRDLLRLGERELRAVRGRRIGFVFQEPMTALNPVFTVGDQIAETLVVHGVATPAEAARRAVALLGAVRMPDAAVRARDYPHQLSGGMRQRALIAAALACAPSLLIADEPTTALDVTIQAGILDLLAEMRESSGLSLLLITHDLGVVSQLADRIAVMYAGRIVEEGPAQAVIGDPLHPYTRGLLASVPAGTPGAPLRAIPGSVPELDALPPGCAFAPRCADRMPACDAARPARCEPAPGRAVRCLLHEGAR
jgi:oligopeptide/dipeptide ABC transporter ATP-binding protein